MLVLAAIIGYKILYLNPFLKGLYSSEDMRNFKQTSWKYSLLLSSLLLLIIIMIGVRKKLITRKFFLNCILIFFLFTVFTKGLNDDILLYFNSKINIENYCKNYVVIRSDPNKVFHIYDKKNEFIDSDQLFEKINSKRLSRNLKSLYNLQNNDTLNIDYKIGFLNVKFLE